MSAVDYQGFRITTLWAFTQVGPDDEEGVIAFLSQGAWMPLIASDRVRLDTWMPLAQQVADETGIEVRLRQFGLPIEVMSIQPQTKEK